MIASKKIVSLDKLLPIVENFKKDGKKIVTTNGAFDLLHVGHVHALEQSKNFGDILIVGVNSDASVKQYKSKERPIIPENERALMIASLECVDYVITFDEIDPKNLLNILQPHVHTKGGDYNPKELKEFDLITQNGGVIKTIESIPPSTTTIIERILKAYK